MFLICSAGLALEKVPSEPSPEAVAEAQPRGAGRSRGGESREPLSPSALKKQRYSEALRRSTEAARGGTQLEGPRFARPISSADFDSAAVENLKRENEMLRARIARLQGQERKGDKDTPDSRAGSLAEQGEV